MGPRTVRIRTYQTDRVVTSGKERGGEPKTPVKNTWGVTQMGAGDDQNGKDLPEQKVAPLNTQQVGAENMSAGSGKKQKSGPGKTNEKGRSVATRTKGGNWGATLLKKKRAGRNTGVGVGTR